jgi:transcriptional regulator with XRE-family HTH domain
MVDYRRIFGENVRIVRKALSVSQEDLGLDTDIDRTYISGIERGVRNPSLDVIVKIARHLKTTPAALLTPPDRKPRK